VRRLLPSLAKVTGKRGIYVNFQDRKLHFMAKNQFRQGGDNCGIKRENVDRGEGDAFRGKGGWFQKWMTSFALHRKKLP